MTRLSEALGIKRMGYSRLEDNVYPRMFGSEG